MSTRTAEQVLVIGGKAVSAATLRSLLGELPSETDDTAGLDRLAGALRAAGYDAEVRDASRAPKPAPRDTQAEALLNAIGEGVCLADRSGRVLWSNRFFATLERSVRDRVVATMRDAAEALSHRGELSSESTISCRSEISDEEAGVWLEVFITPAPERSATHGDLGEEESDRETATDLAQLHGAERVVAVVRDVSSTRRSAARLHAIDRAGYELVRLDADAVRDKNTYQRLQLLEQKIVRLTRDVLHYDHFAIFLIDEQRERLELIVSEGLPPEIQDLELSPELSGSGISGYVAATGQSYICRDAHSDKNFLPGLQGAKSSLTVPLRLHDKVIGVMDVESQSADTFSDEERQFVEIFARHVALALHMLDLLVVERCETNLTVSGRVDSELTEPLEDIERELDLIREAGNSDTETTEHLSRIREDVASIRSRIRSVAEGPATLLGVERALAAKTHDPALLGRRILVADDEVKVRKVIGEVLTAKGARVVVCENGQTAIDALDMAGRGEGAAFDVVLSDIRMPDRNGYEVFSAARRTGSDIPVILMTGFGYDPHHSIVRASQQGLQAVLFKPFEIDQMLDEVRAAVAASE